jgi:PAS domain S-box-containing protein
VPEPLAAAASTVPNRLGLEIAARLAAVGAWCLSLRTMTFHASSEWVELHDFTEGERPSLRAVLRTACRSQRPLLYEALRDCARRREPFDLTLAMETPAGRSLCMRMLGEPVEENGVVVAIRGACQDVTEQTRRAAEARRLSERLSETLDSMTDGFMCWDREWRITYINAAAETGAGVRGERVIGCRMAEVFPAFAGSEFERQYQEAWAEMAPRRFEALVPGYGRWLEVRCFPSEDRFAIYFQDVSERRELLAQLQQHSERLEREVEQRTEQLRSLNAELSTFATAVAHDVRTPLAAIGGFSQALQERLERLGDTKAQHYLSRIRSAVDRAELLLRALLDLARIGQAPLEFVELDLSALALDCVEDLRAAHPGRTVETRVARGLLAVADRRLLRTLLDNLLGNAFKFTAGIEHPVVEVGQREAGVFFVKDNGVGFDAMRAGDVFTPFKRCHGEHEFPGTGIGLASARRVVDRHGGRIWAESREGDGATIWFTLQGHLPLP